MKNFRVETIEHTRVFFLSTNQPNGSLAPEMIPIVIRGGENKKEPVLPVTQTRTAYQSGAYWDGDLSRLILALLFNVGETD